MSVPLVSSRSPSHSSCSASSAGSPAMPAASCSASPAGPAGPACPLAGAALPHNSASLPGEPPMGRKAGMAAPGTGGAPAGAGVRCAQNTVAVVDALCWGRVLAPPGWPPGSPGMAACKLPAATDEHAAWETRVAPQDGFSWPLASSAARAAAAAAAATAAARAPAARDRRGGAWRSELLLLLPLVAPLTAGPASAPLPARLLLARPALRSFLATASAARRSCTPTVGVYSCCTPCRPH